MNQSNLTLAEKEPTFFGFFREPTVKGIIHNGCVEEGKIYMSPNTPWGRDAISYQMQDTLKSI